MNTQIITTEPISVKPCIKCGAMDRYKGGKCRPCIAERSRKYRIANQKMILERKRKYYEANREKTLERQKKYQKENYYKVAEYQRLYRKANREKAIDYQKEYHKANPEKSKIGRRNRRAKIKGNGGKLSSDIIKTLMTLQKGKCACCAKSLKDGHHLDHIMPLALGGMNTDDNVQLLTPTCNLRKSAKHPDDWAREFEDAE